MFLLYVWGEARDTLFLYVSPKWEQRSPGAMKAYDTTVTV